MAEIPPPFHWMPKILNINKQQGSRICPLPCQICNLIADDVECALWAFQ